MLEVLLAGAGLPDFAGLVLDDDPESDDPEEVDPEEVDDESELEDFSALTLAEPLPDSRLSVR